MSFYCPQIRWSLFLWTTLSDFLWRGEGECSDPGCHSCCRCARIGWWSRNSEILSFSVTIFRISNRIRIYSSFCRWIFLPILYSHTILWFPWSSSSGSAPPRTPKRLSILPRTPSSWWIILSLCPLFCQKTIWSVFLPNNSSFLTQTRLHSAASTN